MSIHVTTSTTNFGCEGRFKKDRQLFSGLERSTADSYSDSTHLKQASSKL